MTGKRLRIAIVNDLRLAVEALRRVVIELADCEVAWIAKDGGEAVEKCAADRPDMILMDLIMPEMDGVEATRQIMKRSPCPILVVTATVDGNYTKVYDALGAGALDAVDTPTLRGDGSLAGTKQIERKIQTIRRLSALTTVDHPILSSVPTRRDASTKTQLPALTAIGASTGGPEALVQVLKGLPPHFDAPVVVAQHLGSEYLAGYVSWLARQVARPVRAVESLTRPRANEVLIAAGDDHLVARPGGALAYASEPKNLAYRPSVDVFFVSLARHWPTPGVAVVLTGMGRDGAQGLGALKAAGWATLAQDEATSVVYGMPKAAAETGAAEVVLPLGEIGAGIVSAWFRTAGASRRNTKN